MKNFNAMGLIALLWASGSATSEAPNTTVEKIEPASTISLFDTMNNVRTYVQDEARPMIKRQQKESCGTKPHLNNFLMGLLHPMTHPGMFASVLTAYKKCQRAEHNLKVCDNIVALAAGYHEEYDALEYHRWPEKLIQPREKILRAEINRVLLTIVPQPNSTTSLVLKA